MELAEFIKNISAKNGTEYISIEDNSWLNSDWNLKVMMMVPYLITKIGDKLGIDISKPLKPFPEEPKILFNYKGEF